jgi:prepilin-type N-terminal cleavage/methylation domain-containing protein
MRRQQGFTLTEVLIAVAVIGITFGALALVQVTNLRASVSARLLTDTKAAANIVLEGLMAQVLATRVVNGVRQFDFNDFYWSCPTPVQPLPPGALPVVTWRDCTGTRTIGDVTVAHSIRGESGVLGEGVLTVTVTATHRHGGQTLTLGDRITCYDIYPSPTATAPAPCPRPGGGRP